MLKMYCGKKYIKIKNVFVSLIFFLNKKQYTVCTVSTIIIHPDESMTAKLRLILLCLSGKFPLQLELDVKEVKGHHRCSYE